LDPINILFENCRKLIGSLAGRNMGHYKSLTYDVGMTQGDTITKL